MNIVNVIGRLTDDVKVNEFEKEKMVARGTIAIPDGKNKDGEDLTQFITFVAWNGVAEVMSKYTHKGSKVGISGKLVQNVYKDKDGITHYNTDILVSNVDLLDPKQTEDKKSSYRRSSR